MSESHLMPPPVPEATGDKQLGWPDLLAERYSSNVALAAIQRAGDRLNPPHALRHPIAEFNTRGGAPVGDYLAHRAGLVANDNELGKSQWQEAQARMPQPEVFVDPESGQRLRGQRFNWPKDQKDLDGKKVTVVTQQFSINLDDEHNQYESLLLADELGGPMVVLENLGNGGSDDLSAEQARELRKYGNFEPTARPMLNVLETMGVNLVDVVGYSLGSDVATALAAFASKHKISVETLFVLDDPRVSKRFKFGILLGSMLVQKDLKFTWKNVDPVMNEIAKIKVGLPDGLAAYGLAMTRGNSKQDVVTALESQPDMKYVLARDGSNRVSKKKGTNTMYEELREQFPDRSIRAIVMPGENHPYRDSARRYARLTNFVLNKK